MNIRLYNSCERREGRRGKAGEGGEEGEGRKGREDEGRKEQFPPKSFFNYTLFAL